MFRVVVIQPTSKACGGDPATEEKAAESYASFPTAILITQRPANELRKLKVKEASFFKQLGVNSGDYTASDRLGEYHTIAEALKKLKNEAVNVGHYVKTTNGWVQCSEM